MNRFSLFILSLVLISLMTTACSGPKQTLQADHEDVQLQVIYHHLGIEKMGWQKDDSLIICGFDPRVLDGPRTILAATQVIYRREKKEEPATVILLPLPDVDPGWSCAQANPKSEDYYKILAMAGATSEGFQPDGSLVECERDRGREGRGLFTRTIARLRLKTKLHLKNNVCHEDKKEIQEPEDDHYFLPLDRDGSPFMKLEETLWICFRIHKEKVVCE